MYICIFYLKFVCRYCNANYFYTGEPGNQRGQFNEPRGVAVNECNGDLAVCDTENHRVQIFDVQGNFLKSIGKKGKNKVLEIKIFEDASVFAKE